VDKLSSSLWTSYLFYDVCFVSEDMCVYCACMSKWKQWEMDRVDLSMRTDSKETMINKPSSHLFTDVALPLHGSWGLSDFNYWALKLVTRVKCSSVTDFIARYQYRVISNGLKKPVTDGHWSVTDFTSPLPIGLTFVTGSFKIRYKEFMWQAFKKHVTRSCWWCILVHLACSLHFGLDLIMELTHH
jgi:hypothetical protein